MYDEDQGIDYALIPLREAFVNPLKAAGVVPLDESSVCGLRICAQIT